MRKKLLKSMRVLLVAVLLGVGVNGVWGESLIFNEDFADGTYNVTWGGTLAGGISPAVADGALKVANGSASGDRSAYIAFGTNAYTGSCRLTFDMAMTKSGWDGKNNNFYVLPSANTERYPSTTNAALIVTQDYSGTITIAGETVGKYDGTSLTYDLYLNTVTGKAKVIVKNGSTEIKTISYSTTATGINTLHLNFNKNNGAFAIDNINLYSLVAPAFTLGEASKTVEESGTETVSVTGITGTISVSSNNTACATASYDAGTITINGIATGVAILTVTGTNDGLTLEKEIEVTVGTVSTTTVTVNYLCGTTPIAEALVLSDVAVGSVLTASEVVYNDVIYGTGCRYVNPVLSESLPYTVVEDGVINITYTQQNAIASQNLYARINSENYLIRTESLTGKYIGDVVTFYYPRFYKQGTTLYSVPSKSHHSSDYYKWDYPLDGNDIVIEYNTTEATNVVYFAEGESIDGMTSDNTNNATVRCSDGKGGRSTNEISLTTLTPGVYKIFATVWGGTGLSFTFKAAGSEVFVISTTGSLADDSKMFSVISGSAEITVQGSVSTAGKMLDNVYIQKLGDVEGLLYNGDFSNATWNAGWNGTGSDKKKAFAKQSGNDWFSNNFAEMWTDEGFTAEGNIYQTLINVPAGNYVLSANVVNTASAGSGVLYAKVGNSEDVTIETNNLSAVTAKSLNFSVASTSAVKLGFKTTSVTGATGWIAVDDFGLSLTATPATITSAGFATFSSTYAVDFTDVTEATAYIATNKSGDNIQMQSVTGTVAAGTGLVLKSKTGGAVSFNIPVAASGTTYNTSSDPKNYLFAINSNYDLKPKGTGEGTNYVLSVQSEKVVFAPVTGDDAPVTAGHAALWLPDGIAARALTMVFGDEATGIANVDDNENENRYYNLNGQRISQPTRGLYIVNGRKVLVK